MSIDLDTHTKIAAAGYSSGFSDGLKCASAMVGAPKEAGPPFIPPFEPGPVIIPPIPDSAAEDSRCKDAAKGIKGVDGPLLQTLATVCCTIEEAFPAPNNISLAIYEPEASAYAGAADAVNDQLDQPFKVTIGGGKAPGDIDALDVFKSVFKEVTVARKDAISGVSRPPISRLQELGTVIDGITDFHGAFYPAVPPFAALVVQPPDDKEAPILILAWRGSQTDFDWVNDFAASPTLSSRWSSETKEINAHGAFVNLVENTFSRHEDAMVDLITKHNVKRVCFTGHSLGGGVANVAHLVARAQLKKPGSPWYNLDPKITWLACTFASPSTIVRLYEPEKPPPLIVELDASSFNLVYGCDIVPRPGMLAYVGNFLEIVVPQIIKDDKDIPKFIQAFVKLKKLEKVAGGAVKKLKTSGTAYVMNSLTHLGTVVYQKSEDEEYMYLAPEAKIREVLDVDDKPEFEKLWGDPKHYLESFGDAHLHIAKFVPGAKFGEPDPAKKK